MLECSVVSRTALIAVYAKEGEVNEAFRLFQQMEEQGIVPSMRALSSLAESCARQRSEGQKVHFYIIAKGVEPDVILGTTLLRMYSASGNLEDAERVFDRMPERDRLTWDAMITSYVNDGKPDFALQLFGLVQSEAVLPDETILGCLLGACTDKIFLCQGMQLHARISSAELRNFVMATAIVNMYGRCGRPDSASKVFDIMVERNVVLWTSMLSVFIENGQGSRATQLFEQMLQESILPNEVTFLNMLKACASNEALIRVKWVHTRITSSSCACDAVLGNALIAAYGKCGSVKDAHTTFEDMPESNVISWTGLITVYAQHGQGYAACSLFDQMQEHGILPNELTLVSMLDACASEALRVEGERTCAYISDEKLDLYTQFGNGLVHMYGRCGNLNMAWRIFKKMTEKDVVSWNSMLRACADHGMSHEACLLFCQMQEEGFVSDEATYINLLVAFSHAGVVDKASHCLVSIIGEHDRTLNQFTCMVDLLGRVGLLMKAEELIDGMPFQPTVVAFIAWLGACRYGADLIKGELATKHVYELKPQHTVPPYLLSQLHNPCCKMVY